MKNFAIKTVFGALLLLATLALSSCFKEPDDPTINIDTTIPVGKVYTLNQLKNDLELPYTFDTAASVYATVTMDEINGNLYKQLYVQDATDGIRLTFTETTRFEVGDSIRIYLKGKTILDNHGTYEIQTLQPDSNVVVIANRKYIEPADVTLDQILARNYDLKLVRVHNIQFTDGFLGTTWADSTQTVSAVSDSLEDCNKNRIVLRTSSYAAFAGIKVPCGNGSMVAVAGVYGTNMQLIVRYMSEVDMAGNRCDGSPGICQETVMEEPFATGQGIFETFNVVGDSAWTWKQYSAGNCMEMTLPIEQNEDWLISPAMDLTQVANATLYFNHAINKFPGGVTKDEMREYQTVWISKDYVSGDPNYATWTQWQLSDDNLPTGTDWMFVNANLPVPSVFMTEKNVRIAFKYTCTESFSATWRVKNVSVKGEASISRP